MHRWRLKKIRIILSDIEKTEIKEAFEKLVLEYNERKVEFTCRKLPAVFNSEPA